MSAVNLDQKYKLIFSHSRIICSSLCNDIIQSVWSLIVNYFLTTMTLIDTRGCCYIVVVSIFQLCHLEPRTWSYERWGNKTSLLNFGKFCNGIKQGLQTCWLKNNHTMTLQIALSVSQKHQKTLLLVKCSCLRHVVWRKSFCCIIIVLLLRHFLLSCGAAVEIFDEAMCYDFW